MQVVAYADEGEPLFEELAYTGGAEEKESEDDFVFARVINQLLRGCSKFGRGIHVRELIFFVKAHRHAEVVLAEEENVDTGDSGDLGDVLDARGGLDLQSHDAIVIEVAGVAEESGFVHAALRKINRARASGGIFRTTYSLVRFFGGIDVRNENAVGAEIEGLLDARTVVVSANTDQRFGSATSDTGQHSRKFFVAHGAVLGIDQQPVVSTVGQLLGHGRAVG